MFFALAVFVMITRLCGQSLRKFYAVFVITVSTVAIVQAVRYIITGWPLWQQEDSDYKDPDEKSDILEFCFLYAYILNVCLLIYLVFHGYKVALLMN